jgi:formate hydrogenlyase subunit 6/NADH:ubiquinone oxidoreductase subunit I
MKRKGANNTYFGSILEGLNTSWQGLKLSFKHLKNARISHEAIGIENSHYFDKKNGIVTLQYPAEKIPVPAHGRYQLHNEIDDCIVCDKCVKICPVNCIDIEVIKSAEEIGKTSDGTSKRLYAAKFDIDMAKCCFCGLCTTVCPTECLSMTPNYDFSVFSVQEMNFPFATMTAQEADEKRAAYEVHAAAKAQTKKVEIVDNQQEKPKPVGGKPIIRKKEEAVEVASEALPPIENPAPEPVKKPFKPVIRKKEETVEVASEVLPPIENPKQEPAKKPFKPIIRKKEEADEAAPELLPPAETAAPEPAKKPFKPIIRKKEEAAEAAPEALPPIENLAPEPAKKPFKPIIRKKTETPPDEPSNLAKE